MSNYTESWCPDDGYPSNQDTIPDDQSFGCLNHAPATSHGTYLIGNIEDDVEALEDYQSGGYHPVHLGDRLGETGRYRVLHKLGHGGFSTVWLCRDGQTNKYVAVKVHTADVSVVDLPDLRLVDLDKSALGAEYINIPKDHFSLEGQMATINVLSLHSLGLAFLQACGDEWMTQVPP